jgi:hypothetical protein
MPPLTPGSLLADRYALTDPVPDRGLGETWRARDQRHGDALVQVKFLRAAGGPEIAPETLKAIRAVRALRHPAVPSVVNQGLHDGRPFIVFDDVRGDSVGTLLDRARERNELLGLAILREVFDAVAAALTAAHGAPLPVLHGALTPGSVIVLPKTPRATLAVLLDLGLAPWLDPPTDAPARSARHLTAPPPELLHGGRASSATDVFGLGALLTEMLALPAPLGETMLAVTQKRRRADVPAGVWKALERATAPAPEGRFRTVAELVGALAAAWDERPAERAVVAPAAAAQPVTPATGSLLETMFPVEKSGPVVAARPAPAPELAAAPLLGRMPTLPPVESVRLVPVPSVTPALPRPADWENPWATAMIQGRAPRARDAEASLEQTIVEGMVPQMSDEGMTLIAPGPRAFAQVPAASRAGPSPLDATGGTGSATPSAGARADETLVAAPPRTSRVSPPRGTLIAAPSRGHAAAPAALLRSAPPPASPTPPPTPPLPIPTAPSSLTVVVLVMGFVLAFIAIAALAYRIGSH